MSMGLKMPFPENIVLMNIFKFQEVEKRRTINFSDLKEKMPEQVDGNALEDALDNLKNNELVDFVHTAGQGAYFGIHLTMDGKTSVTNGGIMVNKPVQNLINVEKGNVAVNSTIGSQSVIENLTITSSFNEIYAEIKKIQDTNTKNEVEGIVKEIETELKKESPVISIVKNGISKLKDFGQETIAITIAEIVKKTLLGQ